MNRTRDIRERLIGAMEQMDVIDAHSHLVIERVRNERPVDIFLLTGQYLHGDLLSAGMLPELAGGGPGMSKLEDASIPLAKRWAWAWPYLRHTLYGGYFRPTAIALRDLYGIDELGPDTFEEASARLQAANRPGLFRSVLVDRCRIRRSLVQNGLFQEHQDPVDLLSPVFLDVNLVEFMDASGIESLEAESGVPLVTFGDYLAALERRLTTAREHGMLGYKMAARIHGPVDRARADAAYIEFRRGGVQADPALKGTALDSVLQLAAQWDWPVAVHCGVWGDFRSTDPKNMIDLIAAHPGVRFDLYHLGIPFAREIVSIAKSFPNAHLNLCWTYLVSESITRQTIHELLDAVPVNKIIAFGSDSGWDFENVYGHLVMARQTLAEAFAERIAMGRCDEDGALHILRAWLHDNPARFYRLP